MSTADPKHVEHPKLATAASHSLINVVRLPLQTCGVCAAPVRHFESCWRCSEHRSIAGLADVVAPLVYAVGGRESAATLSAYKNHPIRSRREHSALVVAALLRSALQPHEKCFGAVVGIPVSVRSVIPSLTYRPGVHPLTSIAQSIGLAIDPVLTPGRDARCDRRVRASKFAVEDGSLVEGRHVLVIDDVWTTGSNAQSAALALRRAGAAAVSVLVIGRWLSPGNSLTRQFIRSRLGTRYDPHVCPVTGGLCPSGLPRRSP
jgi:hypothetical protein